MNYLLLGILIVGILILFLNKTENFLYNNSIITSDNIFFEKKKVESEVKSEVKSENVKSETNLEEEIALENYKKNICSNCIVGTCLNGLCF